MQMCNKAGIRQPSLNQLQKNVYLRPLIFGANLRTNYAPYLPTWKNTKIIFFI